MTFIHMHHIHFGDMRKFCINKRNGNWSTSTLTLTDALGEVKEEKKVCLYTYIYVYGVANQSDSRHSSGWLRIKIHRQVSEQASITGVFFCSD